MLGSRWRLRSPRSAAITCRVVNRRHQGNQHTERHMDQICDVAVIVGSLRKGSINRHVANALAELAPAPLKLSIVEIADLPIYNQDGDDNPHAAWTKFRERIKA